MILAIDVGNTNITCGVYEGKKLVTTFRMMSKMSHTSDEYGMNIRQLLMFDGITKEQIEGTVIARDPDRNPDHYGKSQGDRAGPDRGCGGGL